MTATARPASAARAADPEARPDPRVIRTKGLTKVYGDLVAVDHLDFEVRAGEIFGLLGQNGAGKTTTILMLLGLTQPTSGASRVMGLDPARGPLEVKRRVGYMPDQVGFYGDMTGRENLRYTARLNRIPADVAEPTIDEVLVKVGLADRSDSLVETYSRGMLQRLGIADALVKDPDLLILDEPTTAIDPLGVVEVLDLLRRLAHEDGLAILLSSHLLNQVQSVCDRIGIFASGRLIGQGTIEQLAERFGDGPARLEVGVEAEDARRDQARALLAGLPGVASVEDAPTSGHSLATGAHPWLLTVERGADPAAIRRAVLAAVAEHDLPLSMIRPVVPSLEDIYRRAVAQPLPPRTTDAGRDREARPTAHEPRPGAGPSRPPSIRPIAGGRRRPSAPPARPATPERPADQPKEDA
ncbi:MAG: ATP-binding cassette domain-containing protein [Candidatus Limnocylindria bacterium]